MPLAGGGGGLGAAGLLNGLAIQFDTWQNADQGDIAANHTDFVTTDPRAATYRLSNQVALNNLTDGNWHNVHVSLECGDPDTHLHLRRQTGRTAAAHADVSSPTYFGGSNYAYFGFTGATGGASDSAPDPAQFAQRDVRERVAPRCATPCHVQDPIALSNNAVINGSATYDSTNHTFVLTPDVGGKPARRCSTSASTSPTTSRPPSTSTLVTMPTAPMAWRSCCRMIRLGRMPSAAGGGNYGAVGIKNGLGIAFDTWQNADLGDMAGDHTDFFNTGAAPGNQPHLRPAADR